MSNPTSRDEFRDYCLRALGNEVIEINVSESQVQDRIDDALSLYQEFHYDSIERVYLKHQVTADNVANTYIDIPDPVISVTKIFPVSTMSMGSSADPLFNLNYQFRMNDMYSFLYTFSSMSMIDYYLYKRHITLLDEMLNGQVPIRFSKHQNRLYLDTSWGKTLLEGQWVIIECNRILNPSDYPNVWSDNWLKRYAIALIKEQWGNNLIKYTNVKLLGGTQLNGADILNRAKEDRQALELELRDTWAEPPRMLVG
jgi:hypothetical protein